MEKKPNHICRTCGKEYYACNSCDKRRTWRAVACSPECWHKYSELVNSERSKGKKVEVTPKRTDGVVVKPDETSIPFEDLMEVQGKIKNTFASASSKAQKKENK